ncbi:helix-turn-helix domain-containing protein [Acetobacter orientalis]|uniref:helix-turn-helix domain-containing protein n=1 Tax=Acetobacter orientalis TaxID=146474 RepID=UPI003433A3FB
MTPHQIEEIARENGLTMQQVCQTAGVAYSTFTRWRQKKTEPRIGVYSRLVNAAYARVTIGGVAA